MKKIFLSLLFVLLLASTSEATTWYVQKTGSDSNTCTQAQTAGTPKLTIQAAFDCVGTSAGAGAGDKVVVLDGSAVTYVEGFTSSQIPSGTSGNPFVFEAQTHSVVTIKPSSGFRVLEFVSSTLSKNITVRGFKLDVANVQEGSKLENCTSIVLEDNEIFSSVLDHNSHGILGGDGCTGIVLRRNKIYDLGMNEGDHGLYMAPTGALVEYNEVYNNSGCGFHWYTEGTNVNNNIIRYNIVRNNNRYGPQKCGTELLLQAPGSGNQIYGNLIYDGQGGSEGNGIAVTNDAFEIYNNTIVNDQGNCIKVLGDNGEVKNNICYQNGTNSVVDLGSGNTVSNNLTASDPQFTDLVGRDLSLSSSSPAIDNGTATCPARGTNGSACDQGAFETIALSAFEAVDANTINLDFQANTAQPLLPASSVTGFSCREDTNALTISGVVRAGNVRMVVTVTETLTGVDVIDCSYSAGNVTDSALIGDTDNQPLHTFTNQSVTNSISGGSSATIAQSRFRFYLLQGAADTDWVVLVPENANVTIPPGGKIILRAKLRCQVADCAAFNPRLRYDLNGAASYAVVPASFDANNVKALGTGTQPGTVMAEGASITQDQLTSDETTNVTCTFVRTASSIPNLDLSLNSEAECAWAIEFDTDATTFYDFRVYTDVGAVLNSYTTTPRVTIGGHVAVR